MNFILICLSSMNNVQHEFSTFAYILPRGMVSLNSIKQALLDRGYSVRIVVFYEYKTVLTMIIIDVAI